MIRTVVETLRTFYTIMNCVQLFRNFPYINIKLFLCSDNEPTIRYKKYLFLQHLTDPSFFMTVTLKTED